MIIVIPSTNTNRQMAAPVRAFIRRAFSSVVPSKETSIDRYKVSTDAATSAYPMLRIAASSGEGS